MKPTFHFLLLTLLVMAASILFNARPAEAAVLSLPKDQSGIEVENAEASYRFGEQITFVATLKASIPIQGAAIVISDEAQSLNRVEALTVQPDGRMEFRLDTRQNILRPFTTVKWNYQFTLSDGSTIQSASFSVRYADNRFNWQTLEAGTLRVNWYQGDMNFGQAASNAAQAGLGSVRQLLTGGDLAQPIEIYIYANTSDLSGTLALSSGNWVAGHADPALGVVMVVIEPGDQQGITMEQRIPHELMHVMMYRAVGAGYYNIPAWLREGMATLAETYPNADYDRVLAQAAADKRLIPLKDLCASFPADQGSAFLAYAEARSFTDYLYRTYDGSRGLLKLIASYASGVDCEHGPERDFGAPLSNLEIKWRSSVLGQNTLLPALQNISPYLVLLCVVLIIPFIVILITLRKRGNPDEPGS
jgi:hypothetical protein